MKISPLVKNNKTLIAVLSITLVCACVLIYECICVYGDVQDIMVKIEEDDAAIQQINRRQNPNPVKMSEKIILANTEQLQQRIRDIRRKIGNPYRDALKDFLKNLESSAFLRSAPLPPKEFVDARGPAAAAQPQTAAAPAADAQAQAAVQPQTTPPAADAQTQPAAVAQPSSGKEPVELHFSEDEIRSSFADLYNDYYADRKNASDAAASRDNERLIEEHNELFDKFRDLLIQPPESMEDASKAELDAYKAGALETFEKAFYQFRRQIQANTIETIDLQDAKFIFLDALGLPRTMTSFQCKVFVDEILTHIRKDPTIIPGLDKLSKETSGQNSGIEARIPSYTFNHKNMLPPPGNVVHILRHYRIIEDLFRRMRETKIQYLMSISSPFSEKPTGDLSGDTFREMGADYKKFAYEVTLVSTGGEIRDFINHLHRAYQQNIVYDIQELSFFKTAQMDEVKAAYDKVDALRKETAKAEEDARQAEQREREPGEYEPGSSDSQPVKKRTVEDIYADPEYGAVLIGENELVTVVIKFNYIQYVGEILGSTKN
jgi:hypothetical protein